MKPEHDIENSRSLVLGFYEEVCNARDITRLGDFLSDEYIEHNPQLDSGIAAVSRFLENLFAALPGISFTIARMACEDDLVMVHLLIRKTREDRGTAAVDIFRIAGGRIAEHWDVMAPIPEEHAGKPVI